MKDYKLTFGQMEEAEDVLDEMGNDPVSIAYELVWHRHKLNTARIILRDIKNSLPQNRDWLNPHNEKMMDDILEN